MRWHQARQWHRPSQRPRSGSVCGEGEPLEGTPVGIVHVLTSNRCCKDLFRRTDAKLDWHSMSSSGSRVHSPVNLSSLVVVTALVGCGSSECSRKVQELGHKHWAWFDQFRNAPTATHDGRVELPADWNPSRGAALLGHADRVHGSVHRNLKSMKRWMFLRRPTLGVNAICQNADLIDVRRRSLRGRWATKPGLAHQPSFAIGYDQTTQRHTLRSVTRSSRKHSLSGHLI